MHKQAMLDGMLHALCAERMRPLPSQRQAITTSSTGIVSFSAGDTMKRLAGFEKVDIDNNAIQYITDCMANNIPMKIEYENSGWRTVQPYSWTSSKDDNLLVMCYKQDSSIRSYRFDRIQQLFIDSALLDAGNSVTEDGTGTTMTENEHHKQEDYTIPYLPEVDDILALSESEEGDPFGEAVDVLEEGITDTTNYVEEHEDALEQEDEVDIDMDDEIDIDMDAMESGGIDAEETEQSDR